MHFNVRVRLRWLGALLNKGHFYALIWLFHGGLKVTDIECFLQLASRERKQLSECVDLPPLCLGGWFKGDLPPLCLGGWV